MVHAENSLSIYDSTVLSEASIETIKGAKSPIHSINQWGLAIGMRRAEIPFSISGISDDREVYDILPLIRFENNYGFIKDLEGGIYLWKDLNHQVNIYTRFRFNDIPQEFQNEVKGQSFDFGLQYRHFDGLWETDIAVLSDAYKRTYAYTRAQYTWNHGDWSLIPFTEFKWKSSDFNDHYYGFDQKQAGSGVSFSGGVKSTYHVTNNLYLIGQFGATRLENDIYDLATVDKHYQLESFLGIAFYPDPNRPFVRSVEKQENDEYLRVSHGWSTPSNIGEILNLETKADSEKNQMSSVFYGIQVADRLLSLPIDIYFTPGLVWHYSSDVQNDITEAIVAIKAFYTFEFGTRWRLGVAEGLSYVTNITYIESIDGDDSEQNYKNGSKLLNYIDLSLDLNLGSLFDNKALDNTWIGYGLHHRSGIFESSSVFGRIKGGSNYQTVYLQWHF